MARYLNSHRRLAYKYAWGDPQTVHSPSDKIFDVYVDTDFAVCGRTRRSTSAGIITYNGHYVKHYSVTQSTLCLSSGESELHGISKGVSVGLGMQSIAKDLGFEISVRIQSDACAAIGIARRRGLGRIRHLDVEDIWVQQKFCDRGVDLVKVLWTEKNPRTYSQHMSLPIFLTRGSNRSAWCI